MMGLKVTYFRYENSHTSYRSLPSLFKSTLSVVILLGNIYFDVDVGGFILSCSRVCREDSFTFY